MIILRPYQLGDYNDIEPRAYEQKYIDKFGLDFLILRCKPEWAFTAIKDDKKIAIGGIYIYWEGVAEVFLWLSPMVEQYPLYAVHAIKSGIDRLVKQYKLRRLQTLIDAELPTNQRFCELFGFKLESRLVAYGPWGEDNLMYVRMT